MVSAYQKNNFLHHFIPTEAWERCLWGCCTKGAVRTKWIKLNSDKVTQTDKYFLEIFCFLISHYDWDALKRAGYTQVYITRGPVSKP